MPGAIVVVAALVLVPGAAASLAWRPPGALALETRIALAFGLGYAAVVSVALSLALVHLLDAWPFFVALGLLSAGLWALVVLRAGMRPHAAGLGAQFREAPLVVGAELAFLVAVGASRFFVPPEHNLSIAAPWRYWADGLEVAAQGRVPQTTQQWGIEIPTTVSKVGLNAFEAGVSFALGPDPLRPMAGILAVSALGLAAVLLALGRELGLRACALLVPAFTIFVPTSLPPSGGLAHDLGYYIAENVGRVGAFAALLVALVALRSRSRGAAAGAGALFALAGLTHLVPVMVAAGFAALYVLAVCALGRFRWRAAAIRVGAAAATFLVLYLGILAAAGGDVGFQAVRSGASVETFPPGVDPTASFRQGALVEREPSSGHFLIPPDDVLESYARAAFGVNPASTTSHWLRGTAIWSLVAVLLTALIVLVARELIPIPVVAWGLAGLFVLVALAFSFHYGTHVPGDFGLRRLFGYASLPEALLVAAAAEALVLLGAARWRYLPGLVAAAALGLGTFFLLGRLPKGGVPAPAATGLRAIQEVARAVPCDARMLVNARTSGTWESMTGRRSIVEGMAPYLRPGIMAHVLPTLLGSRSFFRTPGRRAGFLARKRVQYVVVVSPGAWIGTAGASIPKTDAAAVAALQELRPVARTDLVSVFAVGQAAAQTGPEPPRCDL